MGHAWRKRLSSVALTVAAIVCQGQGVVEYHYGDAAGSPSGGRDTTLQQGLNRAYGGPSGTIGGPVGTTIPEAQVSQRRLSQEHARAKDIADQWDALKNAPDPAASDYLAAYNRRKALSKLIEYGKSRDPDALRHWVTSDKYFKNRAAKTLYEIQTANPKGQPEKDVQMTGVAAIARADAAYSNNDKKASSFYYSVARAAADFLVGIDPVTGTIRAVYESITGVNLITQTELSDFERGVAIVGVITLGYGEEIGKGLVLLRTLIGDALKETKAADAAIKAAGYIARQMNTFAGGLRRTSNESAFIGLLVRAGSGPYLRAQKLMGVNETFVSGANRIFPELYKLDNPLVLNISLGEATEKDVEALGRAFVGENARNVSAYRQDPSKIILLSEDERRVYRSPILKKGLGKRQANLETFAPSGSGRTKALSNAHIDVK